MNLEKMYVLYIIIFFIGASIGSFVGVIIDRIPKKMNIFFSRSKCLNCGTQLKWYDNIPIISYIILNGKCRYCEVSISPKLVLLEILFGLFSIVFFNCYFYVI